MRITLHGCNSVEIKGEYSTSCTRLGKKVTFTKMKYVWNDIGDLHVGKNLAESMSTALTNGKTVSDMYFKNLVRGVPTAGDYPIRIEWNGNSEWIYSIQNNVALQLSGWPHQPRSAIADNSNNRTYQ